MREGEIVTVDRGPDGQGFPEELRRRRTARGWDQVRLGMEIRKRARERRLPEPSVDGNTISRWERGIQWPTSYYRALICDVLGAEPSDLGLDRLRGGKLDPVKRRDFLRYFAAAGASSVAPNTLPATFEALERLGRALESTSKVDEETVRFLDHRFAEYWQDYYAARRPGFELLPDAQRDLNAVTELLSRSLAPSIRQRLTAIAGRAATVIAALLWDMGIYSESRRVLKVAVTTGRDAGEPEIEAVAWAWTSLGWMYDSPTPPSWRAALDSAAAGRRLFQSNTNLGAWLAAIEGEVHASLGDAGACLRALNDAEQARDLMLRGDAWYWSRFDQSGLAGFRGVCMLKLDRPVEAQDALGDAMQVLDPSESHRKLTLVADLARAYAKADAIDAACSLGRQAVQMSRELRSTVKVQRLQPLQRELAARRDVPQVRQLEEELATEMNVRSA